MLCGDLVRDSVGAVTGGSVALQNRGGGCAVVMMGDSDMFGHRGLVNGWWSMGVYLLVAWGLVCPSPWGYVECLECWCPG